MKLKLAILSIILLGSINTYADEAASCSRFKGSWYGAFWFKNQRDCHRYHGCRHSMLAEVTRVDGTHFSVGVHPNVGQEGVYEVTCVNGKLTSNDTPGVIMFSCIDKTICQIKYDDDRLSANVLSAGV